MITIKRFGTVMAVLGSILSFQQSAHSADENNKASSVPHVAEAAFGVGLTYSVLLRESGLLPANDVIIRPRRFEFGHYEDYGSWQRDAIDSFPNNLKEVAYKAPNGSQKSLGNGRAVVVVENYQPSADSFEPGKRFYSRKVVNLNGLSYEQALTEIASYGVDAGTIRRLYVDAGPMRHLYGGQRQTVTGAYHYSNPRYIADYLTRKGLIVLGVGIFLDGVSRATGQGSLVEKVGQMVSGAPDKAGETHPSDLKDLTSGLQGSFSNVLH